MLIGPGEGHLHIMRHGFEEEDAVEFQSLGKFVFSLNINHENNCWNEIWEARSRGGNVADGRLPKLEGKKLYEKFGLTASFNCSFSLE